MLRGNLSSRPFYNERLVSIAIAVVALATLGLTAFNAYTLYHLSAERSKLKSAIALDTSQADQIDRASNALRRTVDNQTLTRLAGSTQEANALIEARTFSWVSFFGYIEKTMPMDGRLVGVAPRIEKGEIRVVMSIVGKKPEDVDAFVEALQATGAFYDVLAHVTERNDEDGTYRSDVTSFYRPTDGGKTPTASKTTKRGRP